MTKERRELARAQFRDTQMPFMVSEVCVDHKPDKQEYAEIQASYRNVMLDPFGIIDAVCRGAAFTAQHEPEVRRREHWKVAQYVAVDLENDPGAALDRLEALPFFAAYCTFAYTTMSHTPEQPRSRAVFLLERPIANSERWQYVARAVSEMFIPASDPASWDLSRSFLGNPNGDLRLYGNWLPHTIAEMLADTRQTMELARQRDRAARYQSPMHDGTPSPDVYFESQAHADHDALFDRWLHTMVNTPEKRRNNVLNRLAFMTGRYLVAKHKLTYATATASLIGAALAAGLPEQEARATVLRAVTDGTRS